MLGFGLPAMFASVGASGGGSGLNQLTGDVTAGPGTGSQAASIANNAVVTAKIADGNVTNAKLASMATTTVKGQTVGGSGAPVDLTAAQLRAIIAAVSGSATAYLDGTGNFSIPAGGGGGGILDVQHFQAESLDSANPNTMNTANAAASQSAISASVFIRAFLGASLTAAGGKFRAPSGATNLKCEWAYQASAANGGTANKVQWRLDVRVLGSTGAASATPSFTVQTKANNTTMETFSETISLATLGLTAGVWYEFQLVRVTAAVTNNMTQDVLLSELITTWT